MTPEQRADVELLATHKETGLPKKTVRDAVRALLTAHDDLKSQQNEAIARGQLWVRLSDDADVRVMGVMDGYVVARIKGCVPWVMRAVEFTAKHRKTQ